jgi:hypothetical protein
MQRSPFIEMFEQGGSACEGLGRAELAALHGRAKFARELICGAVFPRNPPYLGFAGQQETFSAVPSSSRLSPVPRRSP